MPPDPVVAEIWKLRQRRAVRCGFEIRAIIKDAQERDASGHRAVVRLQSRPPLATVRNVAQAATEQ